MKWWFVFGAKPLKKWSGWRDSNPRPPGPPVVFLTFFSEWQPTTARPKRLYTLRMGGTQPFEGRARFARLHRDSVTTDAVTRTISRRPYTGDVHPQSARVE